MSNENDKKMIEDWSKFFELPIKDMRKLLKQLDFSQTTSQNQNILHLACKEAKKQAIEIIISINSNNKVKKLDINLKDKIKSWTPLYYLLDISDGSETEILQILIKSGSFLNISDNYGITPLHLAAFKGQDEYLSIFLQNNANINALDSFKRTPLHYAIMEGQFNSAYLLLESGAKIDIDDIDGNSLLHYAVSSKGNSLLFSNVLIEKKIDLNKQNNDGDTALMLVAKKNPKENVRLIKKLIHSGAKYENIVNYKCQSFLSLMGEAAVLDKFNEGISIYKNINVKEENKRALENMNNIIDKNIKGSRANNNYGVFISFAILILAFIINKLSNRK